MILHDAREFVPHFCPDVKPDSLRTCTRALMFSPRMTSFTSIFLRVFVHLCSVRDETTDAFVRDLNVIGSFICLGFGSKKSN